jgi:ribosome assembly protein 4
MCSPFDPTGTAKVWCRVTGRCLFSLHGHVASVSCVRWGGEGLLFTGSHDRTCKVWAAEEQGKLVRTLVRCARARTLDARTPAPHITPPGERLISRSSRAWGPPASAQEGHGHWVNCIALSTDAALRRGAHDHRGAAPLAPEAAAAARKKFEAAREACGAELMASGSDDFTCFLWSPAAAKKPLTRCTGHVQLVNNVAFSPDGQWLASAAFDGAVRLWVARTGKFVVTLRGHVGAVYQLSWSGDSRLLASGSKDSTVKVWELRTKKLLEDLPGHADEVFTVDWSPDGERVASGGKDMNLKIWRR